MYTTLKYLNIATSDTDENIKNYINVFLFKDIESANKYNSRKTETRGECVFFDIPGILKISICTSRYWTSSIDAVSNKWCNSRGGGVYYRERSFMLFKSITQHTRKLNKPVLITPTTWSTAFCQTQRENAFSNFFQAQNSIPILIGWRWSCGLENVFFLKGMYEVCLYLYFLFSKKEKDKIKISLTHTRVL